MKLSSRIGSLTGDGGNGWELFFKARRMVRSGVDVTELTIGEPDRHTDPTVLDAMHEAALGGATGYPDIPGIPELRTAIARRLQERTGVPTTAANVIVVPGGQAGLFAAHHAALDEGDRALFIDPYYVTYPGTIRAVGAVPVPVRARPETGFQPSAPDIESMATGARSLLINSPNNPTGAVYSRDTLDGIARICRERDIWLISDEVYDTQLWEGSHLSPRALPGMADRTLVVGSLSKSHAMTGSRIGWIAGPEDAIAHLAELSLNTTYGVPGFIQRGALFALQEAARLEADVSAPFRRRHAAALSYLADLGGPPAVPSTATMYVMLDIRQSGLSGQDFAETLLERHHIAVMPGESFGEAAAGHIRVALTVEDSRLIGALTHLVALWQVVTAQVA